MKTVTITNERLKIQVKIPDDTYKGSRFDRMGMIEKVTLDGKHSFCGLESKVQNQGSGGQGFYNEFGIEYPIAYDEIKATEKFLKIGVGALTKETSAPYDFFHNYSVETFDYDLTEEAQSVTLQSKSKGITDYAVHYSKKISLVENHMIVDYTLENIGAKKIETTEYCHNFITINDEPIGPDYQIKVSFPLEIEVETGDFKTDGHTITWDKRVESVLYAKLKNMPKCNKNFLEVRHTPSGVGIRETVNFELFKVAVWGMPHVISPEAFIKINLSPNESLTWQRKYTFFKD